MYVHRKAKLCFLASPRTASRAVRNAITQPAIGFCQEGAHHDGPEQGLDLQGLTPFCAVRNHWDTTVSWWYNNRMHRKEEKPSMTWIGSHYSKNRYYFRAGMMFWFRAIPNIVVLRYENLEHELNMLLNSRDLPSVKLPKFGVSEERNGRHYSTYYDAHTRHLVEWCFLPEIRELGYRFDEVPKWEPKERKPKRLI